MSSFLKFLVLGVMVLKPFTAVSQTSALLPTVELLNPKDTLIHYPDGKTCTAPANVCGSLDIFFTATDASGVNLMFQGEFGNSYPQETLMYSGSSGSFSKPFDSTAYPEGYYSIWVYGWNQFGNSDPLSLNHSSIIYISRNCVAPALVGAPLPGTQVSVPPVQDSIAPQISILSPANGATVSAKIKNINILVSANDNIGVARVDCYIDGALVGSSTASPSFTVKVPSRKVSLGSHSLTCKAVDGAGNRGTSQAILFSRN